MGIYVQVPPSAACPSALQLAVDVTITRTVPELVAVAVAAAADNHGDGDGLLPNLYQALVMLVLN